MEIKYHKKLALIIVIVLSVAFIGSSYYTYFYGRDKIFTVIGYLLGAFFIIAAIIKFVRNKPVITLLDEEIKLHKESIKWVDVIAWKITDDDNETVLIIRTSSETEKKVSLSWLEKPPVEIERLISKYKGLT